MARGIWKGTLGFGLVNIGVELFGAEASPERLDLDLLDKRDHARIRYRKVNEATGEEVAQEDIVKGYAVEKDRYVVLSDAELKAANPEASRSVDIVGFVPREAIQPLYYAKPYYVAPLKGSEKAYALLRESLDTMELAGVAQIVIRTRQYVAAVYPYESVLVVQLLRYQEELKDLQSLELGGARSTRAVRPAELAMAKQLMDSMRTEWKPEAFSDTFRADVLKLVKQKARGAVRRAAAPEAPEPTRVLDLTAALKQSLEAQAGSRRAGRPRRRPARRAAHRKSA